MPRIPCRQVFADSVAIHTSDGSQAFINAWIRTATVAEFIELASVARSAFRQAIAGREVPLDGRIASSFLDKLNPKYRTAVSAVLSTHRSGYVRELGLHGLQAVHDDPIVVPFLIFRTDDIVPDLRTRAKAALATQLTDSNVPMLIRSLIVSERLSHRIRSGKSEIHRDIQRFVQQPRFGPIFRELRRDREAATRAHAFKMSIGILPTVEVVERALMDRDTRTRRWAARTAFSKVTTAEENRQLLPTLERSRAAWTRAIALRMHAAVDVGDVALEAALLDHDSQVRHLARMLLRSRHPDRAFGSVRESALAVLAAACEATSLEPGGRARIVGALGAIADVGMRDDIARVQPFLVDASPSIRREAERTSKLLLR